MAFIPLSTQVPPRGINRNDQRDFLASHPSLDRLFALNRVPDILEALKVNQPVEFISRRKTGPHPHFVLAYSAYEVVGHARIECLRSIGHDVNKVRSRPMRLHRSFARRSG